jgi:hypothetical protein
LSGGGPGAPPGPPSTSASPGFPRPHGFTSGAGGNPTSADDDSDEDFEDEFDDLDDDLDDDLNDDEDDDEDDDGSALVAPVHPSGDLERVRQAVSEPAALHPSDEDDTEQSADPDEVMPQTQNRRPAVAPRAPTRRPQAGDLLCAECGEGNLPGRNFCTRCGNSLRVAHVVKPPWWRRFVPRRGPKVVKVSQGPGQADAEQPRHMAANVLRMAQSLVGTVVLMGIVVYGVYPPFRAAVNSVVTRIEKTVSQKVNQQFVPIRPTAVTASAQLPGHPGKLAVDGFANTHWSAPWRYTEDVSDDKPPKLTLTFPSRVTLTRLIVRSGDGKDFMSHGRPIAIHLAYSNGKSDDLMLKDSVDPQTLELRAGLVVTSLELEIRSIGRTDGTTDVVLSELEFFGLDV